MSSTIPSEGPRPCTAFSAPSYVSPGTTSLLTFAPAQPAFSSRNARSTGTGTLPSGRGTDALGGPYISPFGGVIRQRTTSTFTLAAQGDMLGSGCEVERMTWKEPMGIVRPAGIMLGVAPEGLRPDKNIGA